MGKRSGFDTAIAIGRTLPDVEVTKTWGAPTLKVRGKIFACVAINKSAEPNSMVVRMSRVSPDALRDLLQGAHRFVSTPSLRKASSGQARRTTKKH